MVRHLLTLVLAGSIAACTSLSPGVKHQMDLGAGYQTITQPAPGEIAKSGPLFNGRYQYSYQFSRLGELGVGIGVQETQQRGRSQTLSEVLVNRGTLVDVSYLLPFRDGAVWVGALYRNLLSQGARFESSNTSSFQMLSMAGPQIRFHFNASSWNWVAGLAVLQSTQLGSRKILEVPGYVGIRFPKM